MFHKHPVARAAILALASLGFGAAALAQETQRIEITGSSIKRIDAETALPVTIIKREDIEKSGFTTAAQLVEKLTSSNGGGYNLSQALGDSARSGQSGASLRGLGFGRTLVLLNGRRMSVFPFGGTGVDLNAIPVAALERIEILRDGASSLYGSDAIGGVMNFITRSDFRGGQIDLAAEKPQKPGGEAAMATVTAGFGDLAKDGYNLLVMGDIQEYKRVRSTQRGFSKTGIRPDLNAEKTSFNAYPANVTKDDFDDLGNPSFPQCNPGDGTINLPGWEPYCPYDYTQKIDIYPPSTRTSLLLRGTMDLNANHRMFGEVSFARNKVEFAVAETPSVNSAKPGLDGYFIYPAGGRFYPNNLVDLNGDPYTGDVFLFWRTVEAGRRTNQVTSDQTRFLVGGEGILGAWDYKYGLMRAEGKARDTYVDGWLSDTKLRAALLAGDINPFGPNDALGMQLLNDAKILEDVRRSKTTSTSVDARMSRELMKLSGGAMALAIGGETRRETYYDGYLPVTSSGDIIGGSGNQQPVSGKRTVSAVFGELNVPFAKGFEANLAIRHDRYSDFGSTTNPKVSLRWQPSRQWLFRASAGSGFRAPGLDDLYAPQGLTNTGGNWDDPLYTAANGSCTSIAFCNTQLTARQGGNAELEPEKAKQFSIGLVFEPTANVSIGVDYFDIRMKNAISFVSGDDILADWYANQTGPGTSSSRFADRLVADAQTGYLSYVQAGYENVGELRIAGVDVSVKGRFATPLGTVRPGYEATYLTRDKSRFFDTDFSSNLGQYASSGPSIRLKQSVSLGLDRGPWAINGNYYWQSGYVDYSGARKVGAYETMDLQAQYTGIKNLSLTFGIRNLFDKAPPASDQDDYFQVGFDPTYADVKLRTYYVRASYKF